MTNFESLTPFTDSQSDRFCQSALNSYDFLQLDDQIDVRKAKNTFRGSLEELVSLNEQKVLEARYHQMDIPGIKRKTFEKYGCVFLTKSLLLRESGI